jgi:hypothetical protein
MASLASATLEAGDFSKYHWIDLTHLVVLYIRFFEVLLPLPIDIV